MITCAKCTSAIYVHVNVTIQAKLMTVVKKNNNHLQ